MGVRYNWQDSSPIQQIDVAKNSGGWLQIVIYAPNDVDGKLAALPQYLTKHGFITYLDEVEGKNVLKIADFGKKEGYVLDALKRGGFISGPGGKTEIKDATEKLSLLARLRKDSMKIGSGFGEIGHGAMAALGALTGDKNRMATAALYGTSTALTVAFGTGAGAIRFSEIVSGMRSYLAKEGIQLSDPLITTPEIVFRERKLFTRLWDTVKTHPIQTTNMIALPGNLLLAGRGVKEMRESGNSKGIGIIFAGAGAALSSLIAMLVPEATPEKVAEYKKQKGFLRSLSEGNVLDAVKILPDSIYMFIARKPLAVQGTLLLADNMGMVFDAAQSARTYQQDGGKVYEPILKGITAGGYSTASLMTALSSKHRDKSFITKEAYDGLYAQTANLIIASPESEQPHIIKKIAEYFSSQPDVHIKQEELEAGLTAKINALRKNPWKQNVVSYETAAAATTTHVEEKKDIKQPTKSWIEKREMEKMAAETQNLSSSSRL